MKTSRKNNITGVKKPDVNGDRPAGKKKTNIFSLLKNYRIMIFGLILFTLLGNGMNLIIPKIVAHGIDTYTTGQYILKTILLEFAGAAAGIFLFTYLQSVVQTYASERVAFNLRKSLSDKIASQNFSFIRKSNPSRLLTNLTSDMDSVKMFVAQAVSNIASSVFVILGVCILLLTIDWKLALPVISIIPIVAITFYLVFRNVRVLFKRAREVIDWLNKVINESILGAALIRVVNLQQPEYRKFLEANTEARSLGISIITLFATLIPIVTFVANLATLTILALGGHFVINGSLTLGEFAAFNSYVTMLIFPIIIIGFMSNVIAQATASYERIESVLNVPDVKDSGKDDRPVSGKIELKDVSLAYEGKPVLKHISFTIEPRSQTAIIGPTAAGKTQLLNVLKGLVPPDSGSVLYDGRPLADLEKNSFHQKTGLVFQDSVMFNLSLRENIAFSDKATEEALRKAIETAELKDYVNTLPKGLDTMVSERGTSLSGGQKQRIMLARALALDPVILFLDDFTARIDRQTEQKVLCNVMNNYPDLTLVSVTQKIGPVKHFDQIILLMEGEVVAAGKHKELKETSMEYAQIYQSQLSTSHYEVQS